MVLHKAGAEAERVKHNDEAGGAFADNMWSKFAGACAIGEDVVEEVGVPSDSAPNTVKDEDEQ